MPPQLPHHLPTSCGPPSSPPTSCGPPARPTSCGWRQSWRQSTAMAGTVLRIKLDAQHHPSPAGHAQVGGVQQLTVHLTHASTCACGPSMAGSDSAMLAPAMPHVEAGHPPQAQLKKACNSLQCLHAESTCRHVVRRRWGGAQNNSNGKLTCLERAGSGGGHGSARPACSTRR